MIVRDELYAAIAEDPTDLDRFGVLADWLLANHPDNPRGELISLMLALDREPGERVRLHKEIDAVFARGTDGLLGSLAPYFKGFDVPPLIWRAGFISRIEVDSIPKLGEIVNSVFEHPSGRFVTEVAIGTADQRDLKRAFDALVGVKRLVRTLEIRSSAGIPRLDELWRDCPRLRHLVLEINRTETGTFALPDLEYATFEAPFPPASLRAIASATWPKLKHLRIMFTGDTAQLDAIAPLFERTDMPALRYLALNNFAPIEPQLIRGLLGAPWLDQLVALDLMGNRITDREAFVMAESPQRWRSDVSLTLPTTELSSRGIAALRVIDPRFGP